MANRDKMMAQPRNPDATLAQELYSKYENR